MGYILINERKFSFTQDHTPDKNRLAEGPTLTLEHVERKSSGIYRCVAENGVRDPVSVDMQLTVLSKLNNKKRLSMSGTQ